MLIPKCILLRFLGIFLKIFSTSYRINILYQSKIFHIREQPGLVDRFRAVTYTSHWKLPRESSGIYTLHQVTRDDIPKCYVSVFYMIICLRVALLWYVYRHVIRDMYVDIFHIPVLVRCVFSRVFPFSRYLWYFP